MVFEPKEAGCFLSVLFELTIDGLIKFCQNKSLVKSNFQENLLPENECCWKRKWNRFLWRQHLDCCNELAFLFSTQRIWSVHKAHKNLNLQKRLKSSQVKLTTCCCLQRVPVCDFKDNNNYTNSQHFCSVGGKIQEPEKVCSASYVCISSFYISINAQNGFPPPFLFCNFTRSRREQDQAFSKSLYIQP